MRTRRYRRSTESDKGHGRGPENATRWERALEWVRANVGKSVFGAALIAAATSWLGGFFDSALHDVVPSGSEAFCVLRETIKYHWPFARPASAPHRFSILIATIDHEDPDHTYTRAVARAFLKRNDIDRIETCRVLKLSDVGRDAEIAAVATARKWLDERQADLLIGGEMLKKDEAIALWFIDKDPTHDWKASTFHLDANLLKQDFSEAASAQLLAVALSAVKPASEEGGRYVVVALKQIAERLRQLLEFKSGFTSIQRVDLDNALGITLFAIGDQAGEIGAFTDAARAFRAALMEQTPEPLQWAMTQNNLGNVLLRLGEQESGTRRLTEAAAAYRAALEGRPRNRMPLDWAMTQNNLGAALFRLGEREAGTVHLTEAVAAFGEALEERTRDLVPLDWAMTQDNLGNALEALGERESGTAHLTDAVAAFRAALEERKRDRVPLGWATTQDSLGNSLAALGERESGTARLTEAVAAFRAALEERKRDRVPLYWAKTQNNLGTALARLGERESGTAHLTEAVEAFRKALQEQTRDRMPLDWAQTQNNLGTALARLGERESGSAHLTEAVAALREALEERTRDRVPLDWAQTQNNLGNALSRLGERESGTTHLTEAVEAWEACLTVAGSIWPQEWVQEVQSHIDQARTEIKRRTVK